MPVEGLFYVRAVAERVTGASLTGTIELLTHALRADIKSKPVGGVWAVHR